MKQRHHSIVDVHVILRRADGRILLGRRANTGYGDGMLHLPSGHLEDGESVTAAAVREAFEETGVVIDPADLRFAHVMHRAADAGPDRVGFFFLAERWVGEPRNTEPDRCSELVWADPGDLPPDLIAYPAAGIRAALAGQPYSLFGWPDRTCDDETLALGLRKGTVTVAEHHPSWVQAAARHAATIRAALGGFASMVEHVGSTAVPGLAAKPIVDLAVRLAPGVAVGEVIDRLTGAGYLFRGDKGSDGGLLFVAETEPGVRIAHLHVLACDDPQFGRYLAVRDRLRADPIAAARYGQLKQDLAAQYADDRAAYTAAKARFLTGLVPAAEKAGVVPPVQRVRAVLITPAGQLLAIRRTKPGQPPHWVLPGGGIEPDDASLEGAIIREVVEETGGHPALHRLIHLAHVAGTFHAIFLARITEWAEDRRSGPEFANPDNGGYHLDELPLDADRLTDGTIWPVPTAQWLAEQLRIGRDLFNLPDLRDGQPVQWRSRRAPQPYDGPLVMVTGSDAKFAIAADHLAAYGVPLQHWRLDLTEIQSTDVATVARHKAEQAYAQLGRPVMVEDSAFGLDELAGYPGALVKHLIDAGGARAMAHLAGLTVNRACTSTAALVYADADGLVTFTHSRPGTVAGEPAGHAGRLPLWTVYIPPGATMPLAAMPQPEFAAWQHQWRQRSVFAQFARWHSRHRHTPEGGTSVSETPHG